MADKALALTPLMMEALVAAVDVVCVVLAELLELAFVVTVSILDSGRGRNILVGLELRVRRS